MVVPQQEDEGRRCDADTQLNMVKQSAVSSCGFLSSVVPSGVWNGMTSGEPVMGKLSAGCTCNTPTHNPCLCAHLPLNPLFDSACPPACQAFYYNVENLLLTNETSIDLNNTNFKFIYEVCRDSALVQLLLLWVLLQQ
jgi:hypothetical protein